METMSQNATRAAKIPTSLVPGVVARLVEEGPDESFERVARLGAMALRAPVAVLSLFSHARLLIKSQLGLPEPWASQPATPLPHAMFRHALATSKPFVVEEVKAHPLTKDMVLGPGWERAAYCGVPIIIGEKRVVGLLSVLDRQPRVWAEPEITFLQDLAMSAAEEIQKRVALVEEEEAPIQAPADRAPFVGRATDGVLTLDIDWNFTTIDPRAARILGHEPDELRGTSFLNAFPNIVGTIFHQEFVRALADQCAVEVEDHCACLGVWLEVHAFPHKDGLAIQLRDVTGRRDAEEALRQSEARYRAVFQESPDPIYFTNAEGSFLECNRAFLDAFGYNRDALFRMRLEDLFLDPAAYEQFREEMQAGAAAKEFETEFRKSDGDRLHCGITAAARRLSEGEIVGWHGVIHDMTLIRRTEEELMHSAFHDPLTGLANRALFVDRLERTLVQTQRRPESRFALLFIDLDRFKQVNDTLGHLAGDEMLTIVARRLETCLREEDTVARLGGDEFALLLDGVQDIRDATRVAERVNLELALPMQVGRREVAASASIGIAYSASDYHDAEQVLHDADTAMYRAKAAGRGRYEVYDTEMHRRALAQLQLEEDLRRAVERAEFLVHYMPVVALEGGAVTGVEALVRWAHPDRGILMPAEFLAVAEQTGLLSDIGWIVLREACRQMRVWQREMNGSNPGFTMSVNISPKQFLQQDFATRLDEILLATDLAPEKLRLEVTEAAVMQESECVVTHLHHFRERGIRVCLDDFGTGPSSLQHMQRIPISAIKIDRSFVRQVETNEECRGLIRTIVAVGRSMQIDAVAEGVETLEQLRSLRELGTPMAQGYLFSQPLDAEAAGELVLGRG
jgi:diguanylate cyclase (GGDEF)-like protein/PAS domain S-box-containing protein